MTYQFAESAVKTELGFIEAMECFADRKLIDATLASATKAEDGWFLAYLATTATRGDSDQFRMPMLIVLCR